MNFSDAIYNTHKIDEPRWSIAEDFCYVGLFQTAYDIKSIEGTKVTLIKVDACKTRDMGDYVMAAMKIVLYATIVIPAIAFSVRYYYRRSYTFEMIKPSTEPKTEPEPSNPSPTQKPVSSEEVTQRVERRCFQYRLIENVLNRSRSLLIDRKRSLETNQESEVVTFAKYLDDHSIDLSNHSIKEQVNAFIQYYEFLRSTETVEVRLTDLLIKDSSLIAGLNFSVIENELKDYLKSIWTFLDHQENFIKFLYFALKTLVDDPSKEQVDQVKAIYQQIRSFLCREVGEDAELGWLRELSAMVDNREYLPTDQNESQTHLRQVKERLTDVEETQNQSDVVIYLLQLIKKQLKVIEKQEKIQIRIKDKIPNLQIAEKVLKCLKLTWLHGTKAFVIQSACAYSEGQILPTGELRKRGVEIITGEMQKGAYVFGRNAHWLSGVNLTHADHAVNEYANKFFFSIRNEICEMEDLLQKKLRDEWDLMDSKGQFSRNVEAISRIKRHAPDEYEMRRERLQLKIEEIYDKLNLFIFKDKKGEFFNWHDHYYTSKLYAFLKSLKAVEELLQTPAKPIEPIDETNIKLAQIPLVLASSNQFGFPLGNISLTEEEKCYPAGLKLGQDISVVFAKEEDIPEVEKLVVSQGLEDTVQVESMEVLKQASQIDRHLKHYFYQIFSDQKAS